MNDLSKMLDSISLDFKLAQLCKYMKFIKINNDMKEGDRNEENISTS